MPELPEVETIAKEFRASGLVGRKIVKAEIFWERSIAFPSPKEFTRQIAGQTFLDITRRGKYLVFHLSHMTLLVHLRMTGKFSISKETKCRPHERVRLWLDNGAILHFEDQRKFGKWSLLQETTKHLSNIGMEPLSKEFSLQAFKQLVAGKKTKAKAFLLNQKYIAGIGNIYADEALWDAKIHPERPLHSLTAKELTHLHAAIIRVLKRGIENAGTSLGSHRSNYRSLSGTAGRHQTLLNVFHCEGKPCPRCGTTICKTVVSQRGTHYCPQCQIRSH